VCLGEVVLSLALANSCAISFFLADSQAPPWVDASWLRQGTLTAS